MATVAEQIKERARKAREAVISKRAIISKSIDEQREALSKLDSKIIEAMKIDLTTLTAEHWFPSLFAEAFDKEAYEADCKKFTEEVINVIDRTRESYEQYAMKVLDEG